ncbi:EVE domain-containing protein [Ktedonobacter robiniae]|uniref:EVE domain-containing protein n=1 Tax=Ktedonobacter robiniae TaxID=2778365 RepID=A0ABQ3UTH9_9CHLR|nr:EVE domain-containing protein [Ktedonobacter robiniae]GHO56091.1 hypothetical protein KSB_45660 [Ktedonobacter robiniae]
MQGRQQKYWAFLANPKIYNIEKAIQQEEDSWTTKRSKVRAGDRAIIWKAKGKDQHRGIVALAEVLTDPIPAKARNGWQYWVDQQKANEQVDRVQVRYYVPSILPLWDDRTDVPILKELTAFRATGGSVFRVTADQWDTLMEIVGGWPGSTPK